MADRFWVGGSGNWSDAANKWSDSSGGTPNAAFLPTSADDVYFDANSNTGTGAFTVTVDGTSSSPSICNSFSTGGVGGALDGAMTLSLGATAYLDVYGSMTLPATNFTWSATTGARVTFKSTSTGRTITTNGISLQNANVFFDGVGGGWTLGSAFSVGNFTITLTNGTLNTSASNYSITAAVLALGAGTKTLTLNGSTVTLTNTGGSTLGFSTNSSGFTFNANTSTITCSGVAPFFNGGGFTFYNASFTSAASGTVTITGDNTFTNNLTFTSRSASGVRVITISGNQTVSGTLTFGTANTAVRRMLVGSDTIGTQRTITLNGTLAALADVDFRDIKAAGTVARPWTGTRLGNAGNVSDITTDVAKTVYWNLAGTQNWSATGWATTNNGAPAVNNFPLPQDTATFTEAGAAGTVTIETAWWIGTIQMADGVSNRTTAFTLATGTNVPAVHGNVTLFSSLTLTGTGTLTFAGQGTTQSVTSAGRTFTQQLTINSPAGTVQTVDALTTSNFVTLTAGTLDLNNTTFSATALNSSNTNTRSIAFGTGKITLSTSGGNVIGFQNATNFTYTGSGQIESTYSGSTGTRTFAFGSTAGPTETNALNIKITAGSDAVVMSTHCKNFDATGFSGQALIRTVYGDITLPSTATSTSSTVSIFFRATSGTQKFTTGGVTINQPIGIECAGATVELQDNVTQDSTRALTLTNGTLNLAGKTATVGSFATASGTKNLAFNGGTLVIPASGATAFNNSNPTGFTTTAGTGTGVISMTSASAKTFVGGGSTYNCTLRNAGAGALTITGSNTFTTITNTVQPTTFTFESGSTQTVTNWSVSGTAGNPVTINATSTSQATLSKSSGTATSNYLNISYSAATGGAAWYALNSVDSGNNSGWNIPNGNFFVFF